MTAGRGARTLRPSVRMTLGTSATTVIIVLPTVLLGSLAILIRRDLPFFDEVRLGLAVGFYWAASAVLAALGGPLSERRGPRLGMTMAVACSTGALLLLSTANDLATILVASTVAGAANGLGQPATNLGLARGVNPSRQGLAFGIKQSAVPMASLLAGLSVPLLGLTLGWRWAVAIVAVTLGVAVTAMIPRDFGQRQTRPNSPLQSDAPRSSLFLLAGATGFGSAAASSLGAFLVLSAVAEGLSIGSSGYLYAAGAMAAVGARMLVGWLADRRGGKHLPVVAWLLAFSSLGYVLLMFGGAHVAFLVVGAIVAFAGWGWPGLMLFSVVRLNHSGPGAATGITASGAAVGGLVGPLLFGLIARESGYQFAWLGAAAMAAVAAALTLGARWNVRLAIARQGSGPERSG